MKFRSKLCKAPCSPKIWRNFEFIRNDSLLTNDSLLKPLKHLKLLKEFSTGQITTVNKAYELADELKPV